jgi:hypothetical protein
MKNIHLLPASKQEYQVKEGGLFINDTRKHSWGKLEALRCERVTQHGHAWNGTGIRTDICHLYITSDEEIKEGDWYLDDTLQLRKALPKEKDWQNNGKLGFIACKKIILTTDQDLISKGIQSIDDEFLEWFVKNPNCEYVEVKKQYITPLGDVVDFCYDNERLNYKIIIPQEEPNPFELPKALPDDVFYQSLEPKQETLTYTEAAKKEERIFNSTMMSKQETLEEAAERLVNRPYGDVVSKSSFIAGAKWQAERMYSEEDMREAFRQGENNVSYNSKYGYTFKLTEKEWFEQFKKK